MKREAGASVAYIEADNPGAAPATVNELRRINRHCSTTLIALAIDGAREGDLPGKSTREPGDRPEATHRVSRRAMRAAMASLHSAFLFPHIVTNHRAGAHGLRRQNE